MKSRVTGDCQARFRENVGVKFPCVTRLSSTLKEVHSNNILNNKTELQSSQKTFKKFVDFICPFKIF